LQVVVVAAAAVVAAVAAAVVAVLPREVQVAHQQVLLHLQGLGELRLMIRATIMQDLAVL
jgi:hypothetical protein